MNSYGCESWQVWHMTVQQAENASRSWYYSLDSEGSLEAKFSVFVGPQILRLSDDWMEGHPHNGG